MPKIPRMTICRVSARISHLRWARASPGLRQDTGVEEGDEVSSYYDPMLGKIIAWGESRATAIDRLRRALGEIEIVGVATNRALLSSVLGDEEFRRGAVATNFLGVVASICASREEAAFAAEMAMAAVWCAARRTDGNALWEDTRGWRLAAPASSDLAIRRVRGERRFGGAGSLSGARSRVRNYRVRILARDAASLHVECDGEVIKLSVFEAAPALHLWLRRAATSCCNRREHRRCVAGGRHGGAGLAC